MKQFLFLVSIGSISISQMALGYELTGKFFEKGSERGKLLFEWKRTEKTKGSTLEITGTYVTPDKALVAVEETEVVDGALRAFRLVHRQLGTEGAVRVEGNQLVFSYTKDGKTESNTEERSENFVVSPLLMGYLAARKDRILAGETVNIRYGVLDRKETIGFSLFKTEEKKVDGVETVIIKMKPSSFFIAAVVDPIYFTLRKSDFRLMEMIGRVVPKRRVGGEWKDLDCDIVYK